MNEAGDDLHPNWVALTTVHFERKSFIREGVSPVRNVPSVPSGPRGSLSGEEAKNFYAEVVFKDEDVKKPPSPRRHCREKNVRKIEKKPIAPQLKITHKTIAQFLAAAEKDDVIILGDMYESRPELLNAVDSFGWTPLMCAAQAKSLNAISFLMKNGADVEVADKKGRTARSLGDANGLPSGLFVPLTETRKDSSRRRRKIEEDICSVCGQRFEKVNDKKHVTSTLHLFCSNRHKKMKTIYGIPESNRGYQILLKTGWDRERGLGRDGEGKKFPIKAKQKVDKNGIGYEIVPKSKSSFDRPEECPINNSKLDRRKITREKIIEINIRKELSWD